jgi:hypothetical protein
MRDANSQRGNSMIPVCASVQPPSPHVSHAETEGETSNPPSLLRSFGEARRAEALAKAVRRSGLIKTSSHDGQRCALLTTKSRKTCTRATVFNSSG